MCAKLLAHKAVVFVGQLSYSLYLWHWPVYVLLAVTHATYDSQSGAYKLSTSKTILGLVVSCAAGTASFLIVEPAFRAAHPKKSPPAAPALPISDDPPAYTATNVIPPPMTKPAHQRPISRAKCATVAKQKWWPPAPLADWTFLALAFIVWAGLLAFSLVASHTGMGGLSLGDMKMINDTDLAPEFRRATFVPTSSPTHVPTQFPTHPPSIVPTLSPSVEPTNFPTMVPVAGNAAIQVIAGINNATDFPTLEPTTDPTAWPSLLPTQMPTHVPTFAPSSVPSDVPTIAENDKEVMCMVELDKAAIDALMTVDESLIFEANILASKGSPKGYAFHSHPYFGPKLFGPHTLGTEALDCTECNAPHNCTPEIVVIGNSHCIHVGPIVQKLAEEYGVVAGMMCMDGVDAGPFHIPLSQWDSQRIGYLEAWKPKLVVWADFWSALVLNGIEGGIYDANGPLKDHFGYTFSFDYTFETILQHASNLLVLGDIPALPDTPQNTGDTIFTTKVFNRGKAEGSFKFLLNMKEEPKSRKARLRTEATIAQTVSEQRWNGRTRFTEVASFFETLDPDNYLQIIDPKIGTLLYKDGNHLNADGAMKLEQVFRKEVFGQKVC